jgi:hypothetical protein
MEAIHIKAFTVENSQLEVLKAVMKALKIKFEVSKEAVVKDDEPTKEQTLKNIKQGFKEMKLVNQGKLKTTPLKDFLDEL